MSNRLINEKSPYLLSHSENPVIWYPWGDEAFNEAKNRNIPIFISIGYSSCHWCHVMEKQCFIDNDVAKVLNDNYISVKVDREERPDIDHIYMEACTAFSGSGGWPLSAFLNHDKTPFFAGTYFPKESFISLLNRITDVWNNNRQELLSSGAKIIEYMSKSRAVTNDIDTINYERLYQKIARDFDPIYGGFHSAPKFPTPQILLFLLRYSTINPTSYAHNIIRKTLGSMADGGIFDHVGGGFFRYSTDREWLVPHFEKMLYDNAMLLMVYSEASLAIDDSYKDIVERIANYLDRVMKNEAGAFYTAEDADSEGIEGKYYLYTPEEIIEILGELEGNKFNSDYDITLKGNFEEKNILNRIGEGFIIGDTRVNKILEYRDKRIKPFKDDKITTSSNALAIAAFSVAGRLLNRPDYIDRAVKCASFIYNNLFVNDRLMARWRQGEAKHPSTLDDYAYLIWGTIELYYATNDYNWLKKSIDLSEKIINLFSDTAGGLFLSGNDINDLPIRQKAYYDGALPSGNSIIAYNFIRLYELTSDMRYNHIANGIMNDIYGDMLSSPYSFSGNLIAFMQRDFGKNLAITNGDGLNDLLNVVNSYNPFLNLSLINNDEEIAEVLLDYKDKVSLDGKATAYFCDKFGCRPPVTEQSKLNEYLIN